MKTRWEHFRYTKGHRLLVHIDTFLSQNQSHPVIVLDGVGSSSFKKATSILVKAIKGSKCGFEICGFSYKGVTSDKYEPAHTASTEPNTLVGYLDAYISRYSQAETIALAGYSLGGLIASEWVYRHKRNEDNVAELILVASPARLKSNRVRYPRRDDENAYGCDHLKTMLTQYTADPESLRTILPVAVLRCENDEFLDDRVYTFSDRPVGDRPVEFPPFGDVMHASVFQNDDVPETVIERLRDLGLPLSSCLVVLERSQVSRKGLLDSPAKCSSCLFVVRSPQ